MVLPASCSAKQLTGGAEGSAAFQEIFAAIEKSEYEIHWQDHVSAYQSPNRAQNMRFTYLNDGFHVMPRVYIEEEQAPWKVTMRLASYGKDSIQGRTVGRPQWAVSENKARVSDDSIVIDYTSEERGVHQTFLVKEKPAGQAPLRLEFELELVLVDLKVNESENCVSFVRNDGAPEEVARYSGLQAWDANGRTLPAAMVGQGKTRIAITVEDAAAAYPVVIDPWFGKVVNGNQSSSNFGFAVAPCGGLDNYGYWSGGVVVGAPYYDDGQVNEGKVFVYYASGGSLPTNATWTAQIDQAYASLGYSVAGDFDVNDDNYSEVMAGAPDYSSPGNQNEGRVFIWAGSANGLPSGGGTVNNALWQRGGGQRDAQFGFSVAKAGDVNNDGFDDIIIGAPYYDYDTTAGAAFVFHGDQSGPSTSPQWTTYGAYSYTYYGWCVASAGDVNGDQIADVIVGEPYWGSYSRGRVKVYLGSDSDGLSTTPATTLEGSQDYCLFGFSVAGGGDVTGDGRGDVIIGAPYYDGGHTDEGKVYVHYGTATGVSSTADWTMEINQAYSFFGYSVGMGDLNVDSYGDVFAGAPYHDFWFHTDNGIVQVYFGSDDGLPAQPTQTLSNLSENNARFGTSVAFAPRFEYGSGPAVAVGAPGGASGSGEASVWEYEP